MRYFLAGFLLFGVCVFAECDRACADAVSDNTIVFVTMVPNPTDFTTLAATFGNHLGDMDSAFRGGDLWARYSDGSLKNLTQAAGYGSDGLQGANSIAVRDPAVNWEGNKVVFSMVIGAPTQRYRVNTFYWQLYEMSGISAGENPVITRVANQPASYNNISPAYASDDSIIFTSDRPRDDSVLHTYPQRDEYEAAPVNSGLWKLNQQTGALRLLDHAPSGDFNPIVDSFGRVIFTRWDHLQRDQQNAGSNAGAFNFESETSAVKTSSKAEIFPEPRTNEDPDKKARENLHSINQFFPWMINQDGTELETLNHIGRQEVGLYSGRSFNDDKNLEEFYGQYTTGLNQTKFSIFLHIKEDPQQPGTYLGTSCQEFGTHSSGQLLSLTGPPGLNPDKMIVSSLTHPDTATSSDTPSGNHTGLYRDPLPLSNGVLIASQTAETRVDANTGTQTSPISRYAFRLRTLNKSGSYFTPSGFLTNGISKSVSFWDPDQLNSYSGPLWEMMAVEVRNRARPTAPVNVVPDVESQVITSMGISVEELKNYLYTQDLALVVSRNVTSRDRNEVQQPFNLRVADGGVQSVSKPGKIYDVGLLQFFQGDLVRGYANSAPNGRRVLSQRMHSVGNGINPVIPGATDGSTKIAMDGSMAAFVPAKRALSWQMTAPDGSPVVRERYWVTFQAGEIRVCSSCHGINTADQLNRAAPVNPPQALSQLLAHWKNLPPPTPPQATPSVPPSNKFEISLTGLPRVKLGGKFSLVTNGPTIKKASVRVFINNTRCPTTKKLSHFGNISGKFPQISRAKIKFALLSGASGKTVDSTSVTLPKTKKRPSGTVSTLCKALVRSLR